MLRSSTLLEHGPRLPVQRQCNIWLSLVAVAGRFGVAVVARAATERLLVFRLPQGQLIRLPLVRVVPLELRTVQMALVGVIRYLVRLLQQGVEVAQGLVTQQRRQEALGAEAGVITQARVAQETPHQHLQAKAVMGVMVSMMAR
jgi:hypothetical protein